MSWDVRTADVEGRALSGDLCIRFFGEGTFGARAIPRGGAIVIGRAPDCDLRIDEASVSRRHARLHLGPPMRLEDLGSSNGTRVGGRAVARGASVPIALDQVFDVGRVMVIVQSGAPRPRAADAPAEGPMPELRRLVDRLAAGTISVLLLGETGVGKEVMARLVHERSPRRAAPFVSFNCAALSESLLESELFGHEKGAFTGAAAAKPGLLESADGGTVFLDEVGELSPPLQAKLLRVLEQREILRVGAVKVRKIDLRFISATNRDLGAEIERGRFRQDLFYRLSGASLSIPPLRQRVAEIEPLARTFVAETAAALGCAAPALSPEAVAALVGYEWPGNIRELRNLMERAVLVCGGDAIAREHLPIPAAPAVAAAREPSTVAAAREPSTVAAAREPSTVAAAPAPSSLRSELSSVERARILEVLASCGGNQSQAARQLGMSRNALLARLDEYGVPRPRKRRPARAQ